MRSADCDRATVRGEGGVRFRILQSSRQAQRNAERVIRGSLKFDAGVKCPRAHAVNGRAVAKKLTWN